MCNFVRRSKNHKPSIQIYSHRGFKLKQNKNGDWSVYPGNKISSIKQALNSYDGIEFDIHSVEDGKFFVLHHDDDLSLFGLPQETFRKVEIAKLNRPIRKDLYLKKLQNYFSLESLKIIWPPETSPELLNKLIPVMTSSSKQFLVELKEGGRNAFRMPSFSSASNLNTFRSSLNQDSKVNLISFYWFTPVIYKLLGLKNKQYFQTGINVVGDTVSPQFVWLAAILGFDSYNPPHKQISEEILKSCHKHKLKVVSWSSGDIEEEDENLRAALRTYFSIPLSKRPTLGLIVNRNYEEVSKLIYLINKEAVRSDSLLDK
ncbi:MAG TPA: glycerophosphodiester phosphodiesterase family protein [Vampirovibrionales bacterium]